MKAVTGPVHLADVPRVGRHELPAAAVRRGPRRLVEVARARRFRREGRTSEQLPAGCKMHEIENLATVKRVEPDEKFV